ncbi:IclR family transcriptional regulator [Microbacterium sp. NPDC055357]
MRTADWTVSVSVLDRLSAVLDAFGEHDEGLGVSELARRAGLPKSTVSRIAADLVEQRFLDRDGDKLYLGVRLFELGQTVQQPRVLRRQALPVLRELRDVTGQTVNLGVLDGADVVVIAVLPGASMTLPPPLRVGARLPAYATAMGKAVLAVSRRDVVSRVVAAGFEPRTPQTITDEPTLLRDLAGVRHRGAATDHEEYVPGVTGTASPVLGAAGIPVAAISVAGPTGEFLIDSVVPAVRAAALTLSRRLATVAAH